jgi:hypothetical protein
VRDENGPADSSRGGRRSAERALVLGAVVLLLGLLFRLTAVFGKFLWFDEFLSANLARRPWSGLLSAVRQEAHPPLYFFLLKAWTLVFGDGPTALKALSLTAGVLAGVFLFDGVRRVFGALPALAAATLFAFSTVQIDQSSDAKPYALLTLFLCLTLWSIVRLEQTAQRRFLLLGVLAAAACVSTHFYGALAAPAVALSATLALRGRSRRGSLLVLAGSLCALIPWLPAALGLPRGASDYIREIWGRVPGWAPLAVSARISLPAWRKPYPPMNGVVLPDLSLRELIGFLLIASLFVASFAKPAPLDRTGAPLHRFMAFSGCALSLGFLAAETVAGLVDRPIGLPGRLEVVPELGLALLAAAALSKLWSGRWAFVGALAALGLWTAEPQWRPRTGPEPRRREEVIVGALAMATPPGKFTEIVTLGLARPPFDYYGYADPQIRLISFPASQDEHPGWRVRDEHVRRRTELEADADRLVLRLEDDLANGIRVYIAAREDPRNEILLSRLRRDHDLVPTKFADWFFELRPAAAMVAEGTFSRLRCPLWPKEAYP